MSNIERNPDHIQTVDQSRHGKLKLKLDPGFAHAKNRNLAAINVAELGISISNFPVVFFQSPSDKRYLLMAMLGLKGGENIYYGPEYWESTYVPLAIQRHPFVVGFDDRVTDTLQLATCLEMNSACLNDKEGVALYTADGKESETLAKAQQMLGMMFDAGKFTEEFVKKLRELDLIVPFEIELQMQRGAPNKVSGLFTLDENRLKALSAEQLKDLQSRDMLAPCYLMLVSLYQLNQLIRLRNRKGAPEQIVGFRLEFPGEKQVAVKA